MSEKSFDNIQILLRQAAEAETNNCFKECEQLALDAVAMLKQYDKSPLQSELLSRAHCWIARAAYRLANFERSREYAKSALHHAEIAGARADQANALRLLATAHQHLSEYDEAFRYCREAIGVYEAINDQKSRAIALGNLGLIYRETGDFDEALKYALLALGEHIKFGMHRDIARVTGNVGLIYYNLGDYENAFEYLLKALSLHNSLGNQSDAAKVLSTIGSAYHDISDFPNALKYMHAALSANRELGNNFAVAAALCNLGVVYKDLDKDSDEFLDFTKQALDIFRSIGTKSPEAVVLNNLGCYYRENKDYGQAMQYLVSALSIHRELGAREHEARDLEDIGLVHLDMNNYEEAEKYLGGAAEQFREIGDQREYAHALANLGTLYSTKPMNPLYNTQTAEEKFIAAIDMQQRLNLMKDEAENRRTMARIFKEQLRWEEYSVYIERAHKLYQEIASADALEQIKKLQLERKMAEMEYKWELERRELEQKLLLQNKELQSFIERMVEKNKFLTKITNEVKNLQRYAKGEGSLKADELIDKIRINISSAEDNETLDRQLRDAHRAFIKRLQSQCPTLTPTEIKIATLLRMNLTSPNIASALYISSRTVEYHRAQIRKKLGLDSAANIYMELEKV